MRAPARDSKSLLGVKSFCGARFYSKLNRRPAPSKMYAAEFCRLARHLWSIALPSSSSIFQLARQGECSYCRSENRRIESLLLPFTYGTSLSCKCQLVDQTICFNTSAPTFDTAVVLQKWTCLANCQSHSNLSLRPTRHPSGGPFRQCGSEVPTTD